MDWNPVLTKELAETFTSAPVFTDIAKAIETLQDRAHYLPTIVPPLHVIQPVGVNPPVRVNPPIGVNPPVEVNPLPLRIWATREETITATMDMTKLITNAIKIDGSLKSKVPDTFNRDQTKTQKFLNTFSLFWMNNEENSHMKTLYKRCTYFLGLFNRSKVEDWVQDQTAILQEKTIQRSDLITKTDEDLWDDLINAFENTFAHMGQVEQARMDLAKLEMEGNQVNEYIAKFENLLCKSDIPQTEVGSIQKFKDGLRQGVLQAILNKETWPTTIDQWEEAARQEVRMFSIIKEAMGDRMSNFISTKQAKW
jgi:hypothetical protein